MNLNEIKGLKRLPISHLSLIILNDKNDQTIRKFAEIELKKRINFTDNRYEDLLDFESERIKERGFDINEYLFSINPSMQKLMELYFAYSYCDNYYKNKLLISERHICNNMDFCAGFFDKICEIEMDNIEQRLENTHDEKSYNTLFLFKKALEKRKINMIENKKRNYSSKIDLLGFNECFQILANYSFPCLSHCKSDEEIYKILTSLLRTLKYGFTDYLRCLIFNFDLSENLYILREVLDDSKRLNVQKQILMNQAKSGFEVDYSSSNMEKVLKNVQSKDF